jgi:hypothetical protein
MPKLHLYATREVFLPPQWRDAAGLKAGTGVKMAMTAFARRDLAALLEDRGWGGKGAESAAASLRSQWPIPAGLQLLHDTDARLFPLPAEDVTVWFWAGAGDREKIHRVTLDDATPYGYRIEPIARFRREDGQAYVEVLNPASGPCQECDSADVVTFEPSEGDLNVIRHVCQVCGDVVYR